MKLGIAAKLDIAVKVGIAAKLDITVKLGIAELGMAVSIRSRGVGFAPQKRGECASRLR